MVETTHEVTLFDGHVVKRYRSWEKGEPEREWNGLSLLHRTVPGLSPQPLEKRTMNGAPAILMTRVPGESLGAAPLDSLQQAALGRALDRMFTAVPVSDLMAMDERNWGPGEMVSLLRSWMLEARPAVTPFVESALEAATTWVDSPQVTALAGRLAERVFTMADGNIGNFLWDGERCHVVDFEDCGVSDPAYEVADLLEHVSVWLPGLVEAESLIRFLGFSPEQESRLLDFRRLMAVFWLMKLLPGNPGHARNPHGSLERQADRLLGLL